MVAVDPRSVHLYLDVLATHVLRGNWFAAAAIASALAYASLPGQLDLVARVKRRDTHGALVLISELRGDVVVPPEETIQEAYHRGYQAGYQAGRRGRVSA